MSTNIIAEIAKEHEGNIQTAKELITLAAANGADAVKFQSYCLEDLNPEHPNFERYKQCHLSVGPLQYLADFANKLNIGFHTSCFSISQLEELSEFTKIMKVPSTYLMYEQFVSRCIELFDEVHLSTGMHNSLQIDTYLSKYITLSDYTCHIIPYHCVSEYPTATARLTNLKYLRHKWGTVGYSDHTTGIQACVSANTIGVKYIEKHFSKTKSKPWCMDPFELATLVREIEFFDGYILGYRSEPSTEEKDNFQYHAKEFKGLNDALKMYLLPK